VETPAPKAHLPQATQYIGAISSLLLFFFVSLWFAPKKEGSGVQPPDNSPLISAIGFSPIGYALEMNLRTPPFPGNTLQLVSLPLRESQQP
jgi:hypothetical protein